MLVRFELKWEMKRLGGGKPILLLISLIFQPRGLSESYNMRHNSSPLTKPSQVFLFPSSFSASSSVSCDSCRFFPQGYLTGQAVMGGFTPALGSQGLEGARVWILPCLCQDSAQHKQIIPGPGFLHCKAAARVLSGIVLQTLLILR